MGEAISHGRAYSLATTLGTLCPTHCNNCVGCLKLISLCRVYRPYPRNYKSNRFLDVNAKAVISRP